MLLCCFSNAAVGEKARVTVFVCFEMTGDKVHVTVLFL